MSRVSKISRSLILLLRLAGLGLCSVLQLQGMCTIYFQRENREAYHS